METLEVIAKRRSVRSFLDQPVEDEKLDKILHAAMNAPSAGNAQPWHFVVINDRAKLNKIPTIHPYAKMCLEAPVVIMCCGDLSLEKFPGFWVQDVSAATQNILLAVRDLGLGAIWAGVYPIEERVQAFKGMFHLPENIIPLNIIPIGYTDRKQEELNRYQLDRIHREMW